LPDCSLESHLPPACAPIINPLGRSTKVGKSADLALEESISTVANNARAISGFVCLERVINWIKTRSQDLTNPGAS